MPLNLLKKYPDLLSICYLDERERNKSLRAVFDRDITNNPDFRFLGKNIYPIKTDGEVDMDREFKHLTCKGEEISENCKIITQRIFDQYRSERLHWIKIHAKMIVTDSPIEVFSLSERDKQKRKDVIRTYIYNKNRKYVIVFEPLLRGGNAYYLLSAYYLNEVYGEEMMRKKMSKKLSEVL